MELFLYYLLRASILMVLFYALYKFFFANNTFHDVNRLSLIFMLLVVSVLPLFRFNLIPEKKPGPVTETFSMDFSSIPVIEFVEMEQRVEIPWTQILMIVFAAGFLFTFIRYLIGLGQIIAIIRKSEKRIIDDHTVLCVTDKAISPFSWMKYIVLSRKELSDDSRAVVRHESAHIHLKHSFDMIFFDIFTCLFWFNPFSWLLRREIQSVHEYQADEQVLNYGVNSRQYQLLLIRKSVGEYKFALANNFRQRDLHKRITMMKKTKTDRRMKWNYVIALPILFLAMIALSLPKLNAAIPERQNNESFENEIVDPSPERDVMMIAGTEDLHTAPQDLENTGIVPKDSTLTIDSAGKPNIIIRGFKGNAISDNPLIIIDGEKSTSDQLKQLGPDNIESVSILKDKSAVEFYGDEGKNGVVLITTKKSKGDDVLSIGSGSMDTLRGNINRLMIRGQKGDSENKAPFGDNPPLIIVDGKKMPKDFELNSIDPSEIESLSVLKDANATDAYGEEAQNGVVSIMTKENMHSRVSIDDKDKKQVLRVTTYKTGEVTTFGDFKDTEIFIGGKKSSLEQLQALKAKDVKGMVVAPQNLDSESSLHKKYKVARSKNIVEITL